jgi:SET domain-containing protein
MLAQVVRQWLPSRRVALRVNIDATKCGNVARFANHRCGGGNLSLVVVMQAGRLMPRIALVTNRHVACGEELCFEYGQVRRQERGERACLCGSCACLGGLPLQGAP